MKKSVFALLLFLFLSHGVSAQKKNVYFIKNNGQYVMDRDSADYIRIVQEREEDSKLYPVSEYYTNNKLKSQGMSLRLEPPLYEGSYRSLYPNGNNKETRYYEKGVLSGKIYEYFPNGNMYTCLEYSGGDRKTKTPLVSKVLIVNDSTGKPLVEDGNGLCELYDKDFKMIIAKGMIKDGLYEGVWTGKETTSSVTFKETYAQGKLISGESTDSVQVVRTYTEAYKQPEYKGGMQNFYRYLGQNIRYPTDLVRSHTEGMVNVQFVVDQDGWLRNMKVLNYVHPQLGQEAIRVIGDSGRWNPGLMHGRPVPVTYTVPVSFTLSR